MVQDSFDLRPTSLNGPISGSVIGNDQIYCGNVLSTFYLHIDIFGNPNNNQTILQPTGTTFYWYGNVDFTHANVTRLSGGGRGYYVALGCLQMPTKISTAPQLTDAAISRIAINSRSGRARSHEGVGSIVMPAGGAGMLGISLPCAGPVHIQPYPTR